MRHTIVRLARERKGYMPRRHRTFLGRLEGVRELVTKVSAELEESKDDGDIKRKLVDSYNLAVNALKTLRDAHYKVVAMYIIGPAAREKRDMELKERAISGAKNQIMEGSNGELKGTGGSELSTFLKSVRTRTKEAII
jgi:indoleamine 2,3-dioxygenase